MNAITIYSSSYCTTDKFPAGWPLSRHCEILWYFPDRCGTTAYIKCRSYHGRMLIL